MVLEGIARAKDPERVQAQGLERAAPMWPAWARSRVEEVADTILSVASDESSFLPPARNSWSTEG